MSGAARSICLLISSLTDATFTRATTAYDPYTGASVASGVARFPQPTNNRVTYSEDLTNAAWTKNDCSVNPSDTVTIQANGRTIALQKVNDDTTNALHYVNQAAVLTASSAGTSTIYAKADGLGFVWASFGDAVTYAFFNLSTGATATVNAAYTASIHPVGNGVYRCEVNRASLAGVAVQWGICAADNTPTYAGTGTKGVWMGAIQGENVAASTAYNPTGTAIPGQGLMVEEGTTNLLTAGESQGTSGWNTFAWLNSATVTNNDATHSWEGSTSVKIATAGGLNLQGGGCATTGSFLAGAKYTGSVWVYAPAGATLSVITRDPVNNTNGTALNFTGNGQFQRVSSSLTLLANTTEIDVLVYTNGIQAVTYWCDGAQVEQKSYATSWTLGGTTRNAETLTVPNTNAAVAAGAFITRIYVDGDAAAATALASHVIADVGGTVVNRFLMYAAAGTPAVWYAYVVSAAGVTYSASWAQRLAIGWHTVAMRWASGNVYLYVDGVQRATAVATLPASLASALYFGSDQTGAQQWDQPIGWFASIKSDPGDAAMVAYTSLHDPTVPARLSQVADYFVDFGSVSAANGGNTAPSRNITVNAAWGLMGSGITARTINLYSGRRARLLLESFGTTEADVIATYMPEAVAA